MKAPRRLSGSRIAVGVASVGLTVGAFSLYSRKRYGRSAAASLAEYGVRPVKTLAARIPMTERIARLADRPEPARTVTFPAWGRFFYDLERSEDSGMPVYHVRQRTPSSAVIVYLHGGGYIATAVSAHAWLVDHLARRTGADIVMPLYPLAPHHTWQEAHRLVLELYRRTVAQNPGKRIVLMGDSAGGGLAAVIALSLAEAGDTQPDELALISPWVDITNTNPDIADYVDADPLMAPEPLAEIGRSWAGSTPPTDWHLSPIYGDLSGLKKVTTFVWTRRCTSARTSTTSIRCSPPRRGAGRVETSSASSPASSPDQPAFLSRHCEAEAHHASADGLSPPTATPRRARHGYESRRWSGCTSPRGNSATRTSARSRPEDGRREPRSCAPSPPAHR